MGSIVAFWLAVAIVGCILWARLPRGRGSPKPEEGVGRIKIGRSYQLGDHGQFALVRSIEEFQGEHFAVVEVWTADDFGGAMKVEERSRTVNVKRLGRECQQL